MAFRIITAVSAFALMTLSAASALAAGDPLAAPPTERSDTKTIIIGSADFPESQLLATLYAKALTAKGVAVETKLNIGSREVYMPALLDGSIDLLPEYAGAALSYLDKKATAHTPDDVAAALKAALPKGVSMLTPSAAQDSDGVAVTRATAEKYKLKTIADLAPVASEFVLGGPPEWKTRKEGIIGLKEVYGLEFKSLKALDVGGPLTLSALVNGQIQAANLFSTDPAIATNDLVMLEDVKNLFPAQNVVPVIATAKVSETVAKTLDAVSAALTTKDLVVMNGRLGNHDSFDVVAGDWLAQHKLN
ncbi:MULTISPECIES: ABC transporter substrate-binding protein [Rhizobium/Agrobacterium group]|uniref:ABC transporter substrate binding protein (Proline/glycine/betaine) n=2 Tax=Rhizobium/Agrobacterium group TaxID=227290 RepID=B9JQU0_ALLAM|nr:MULTISPECIES: ABC transporter substrate-binding protein [Rhizobium/Agrobacterium group]ACM35353.1 ABC transporter substrate binding protein (proline/glycine/betaine) [Allorhizobium ampelinum S4]MCF1447088.1 ABC transporter substrate-binding protein [Allorhizobium ampelinum]MCF1493523.1 ABC transporter substrate-binding protein [Allorhizobium ampelinum]MUO28141.1 glycine/betaine ABC transporter substrate-binding protein [Agrobacterium vitis]MUO40824.1 glycine/betaine ABC transporter substrat